MRSLRYILACLGLSLGVLLGAANEATVPSHQVRESSLYEYGEEIVIQGVVKGDVWAAANHISIEGIVLGSCFLSGGSISITGQVQGNVRALSAQLHLDGLIAGNLRCLAAEVKAGPKSRVLGTSFLAAGNAQLGGKWDQRVRLQAGSASLQGAFQGPVRVTTGDLEVASTAKLFDQFSYWTRQAPQIAPGAQLLGHVEAGQLSNEETEHWLLAWLGDTSFALIHWIVSAMNILYSLLTGLMFLWLFPQGLTTAVYCLRHRPWASLGLGVATLLILPIVAFIMLLTVLGIPVALTVLALNVFGLYTAKVIVMYWMGMVLMPRSYRLHRRWVLILGIIPYFMLTSMPVVGNLLAAFCMTIGLGAVLLSYRLPTNYEGIQTART